ncbi:MAG: NAD-dependent epimerase/dehydratase family protein [Alphaproteobacteria bacterium]|nr:NAD-dependent epimerase/dehydratase family protein [Alphaproteobacteria bacterium]
MKVVVTGGAGFTGRHLCDAYADRGDAVVALDVVGTPWRDDVTLRHVDLRDADAVVAALGTPDLVVHNASLVHTKRNRAEDVWAVNLGGTEHVLAACRAAGVGRLVYISSASVVYQGKDIEHGDEALPYSELSQAPYADSKIAAERLVLAAHGDGLATCAIRPHVVFGPGDARLLPAILARARAGKLKFSVGDRSHLSDFTFVDNLVDAVLAAGDRLDRDGPVGGQAYFVTNGEPMPFFGFVDQVLARLDLPPIRGSVPFWLAYGVAAVVEGWDTLKGGTLNAEDGMTRFAIRYMCTHHYFSIDKARRDLGYDPRVSIAEGIERTVAALS